eukprot:TRINITY_DN267_c3_g1_i1.p2 TRINITY_DN267_c3_g1~~TRINITY_DN267_c3_g1_i1.p2  ORF type:complete len:274 (+),score=79.04 TRINITY_DN267_c3_g1_i1:78-899(+)
MQKEKGVEQEVAGGLVKQHSGGQNKSEAGDSVVTEASTVRGAEGPLNKAVNNRIRAVKKKLRKIDAIEQQVSSGKDINEDQASTLSHKRELLAVEDELERMQEILEEAKRQEMDALKKQIAQDLREQIRAEVQQEFEANQPEQSFTPNNQKNNENIENQIETPKNINENDKNVEENVGDAENGDIKQVDENIQKEEGEQNDDVGWEEEKEEGEEEGEGVRTKYDLEQTQTTKEIRYQNQVKEEKVTQLRCKKGQYRLPKQRPNLELLQQQQIN